MSSIRRSENTSEVYSVQEADGQHSERHTQVGEDASPALSAVPEDLKRLPRWVVYRLVEKKKKADGTPKLDKVPLRCDGRPAKSNDPTTWATFDECVEAWQAGVGSGVGFVFNGDGIVGVDLDKCIDEGGEIETWAAEVVRRFATYAERSPSGRGLHLFVRGDLPEGVGRVNNEAGVEMYGKGRFFTVTGDCLTPSKGGIEENQAAIDWLADEYLRRRKSKAPAESKAPALRFVDAPPADDEVGKARALVDLIDPRRADEYAEWIGVGHAMKAAGLTEADWLDFSARCPAKYDAAEASAKWASFDPRQSKFGHLVAKAREDAGAEAVNAILRPFAGRVEVQPKRTPKRLRATTDAPLAEGMAILETGLQVDLTDDGIASAFADENADRLRFDHNRGQWYRLRNGVWRVDEDGHTRDDIVQWCRRLADLVDDQQRDLDERKRYRIRERLCSIQRRQGVEAIVRDKRSMAVVSSAWDRDPMLAGTPEGVLDIEAGEIRPATGEELITRQLRVAPAPAGTDCPRWRRFLEESMQGDLDLVRYLQRWFGYCLTGSTREEVMMFGHGSGGNGKTAALNIVSWILGDYAQTASMDTFHERRNSEHSCELAALAGARLVIAEETHEGRHWAEGKLKALTGGGQISARFMHRNLFTFKPAFKLTIAGNHRPRLKNPDPAFARRMHLVPWDNRPAVPDQHLGEKLRAEAPAILRWMLEGARMWLEEGLAPPQRVLETTKEYLDGEDEIGTFIEDRLEIDPDQAHEGGWFLPTKWLVEAANQWRTDHGDGGQWVPRNLVAPLRARGARPAQNPVKHAGTGTRHRGWYGVRLVNGSEQVVD